MYILKFKIHLAQLIISNNLKLIKFVLAHFLYFIISCK